MIEYIIILLLSFPPLLWFKNGYVLLGHDSGFRLDYLSQFINVFYSWDPKVNFGTDWSQFKGFLVTQFPEITFSWLTHSFRFGEILSLVFWFAVMGVGMLMFLRALFPGKKYLFFRIFSSIFYMYNYFILDGWTIGERAKFSLYAALPLGLLLIYNALTRDKSKLLNGILFGLLYFFLNGGGVPPLYGATVVVFGLAFIYFARGKPWSRIIGTLFAFTVPFLLLNAYYIIPNIFLLRGTYGQALAGQGGINGLILWERVVSSHASLFNLLRLQGVPTLYDNPARPFTQVLLTNPIFIAASFIPIVSILIGLIAFRPKNPVLRFLLWLLPFGLVATMGTHPPTGIVYELAMKKIPGFVMFRSSFYKFAPAFWFPMIVLTGYFLNEFLLRFVTHKRGQVFIGISLLAGLLIYHYPFFTTQTFNLSNGFSTRVRIPLYLTDISGEIKKYVSEDDAVLVMPKMREISPDLPVDMYTWHFFSLDIFPRNAINRRFVANDSRDPMVGRLYDALYAGNDTSFLKLSELLHINYILWRRDAITSVESVQIAKTFLMTDPHIKKVFTSGPWELYKIDLTSGEIAKTAVFAGFEGSDKAQAYLAQSDGTVISPGTDIIEGECIMCQKEEYAKLVASIVPPATRFKPGSLFFPYEQWQEQRLEDSVKNKPKERIDADIALAQKYLAWNQPNTYASFMNDALTIWQGLKDRDRIVYAIRLKAYFDAEKMPVPDELAQSIWSSEPGIYRFIASGDGGYDIKVAGDNTAVKDFVRGGLRYIEVKSSGEAPFVFLQKKGLTVSSGMSSVSFTRINPTKYTAHVTADSRYLLVFKEQFDAGWDISVPGKHVEVDGFANGWIIDKTGSYEIVISYKPQGYFYVGLLISGISLAGAVYFVLKKTYV